MLGQRRHWKRWVDRVAAALCADGGGDDMADGARKRSMLAATATGSGASKNSAKKKRQTSAAIIAHGQEQSREPLVSVPGMHRRRQVALQEEVGMVDDRSSEHLERALHDSQARYDDGMRRLAQYAHDHANQTRRILNNGLKAAFTKLFLLLPFPADPSPMEELAAWALTAAAGSLQPAAGTPKAMWSSTSVASSSPVAVGTQVQPQTLSIMPPQQGLLALPLQPPAQLKATHVPKSIISTLPPHPAATQPTLFARFDAALESDTDETARRQPAKPLSRSKRKSPHVSDSPSWSDQNGNRHHKASDVVRSDEVEDDEVR
ncbi:hypothetical protein BBJ28_00018593 [Nothophytophthora sp. Chile5]|nr:hypothetical protein BBJ28_00018593 [Nothophytophthora sp. Chile5]